MEKLTDLYRWLHEEGVFLFARPLPFRNQATKSVSIRLNQSGAWGIFLDTEQLSGIREEYSAVLHEGGHYATGTTHAVNSPFDLVEQHENRADKWAVRQAVSQAELEAAVAAGHTELWDLAEHFGVTEELMRKVICLYTHGNLAVDLYM